MPSSFKTAIASDLTRPGRVPALSTSKRSPASCLSNPSAIWLRAELPVQRIKTRFFISKSQIWSSLDPGKHHLFCFGRKRGHKPAKESSRRESAEELCHYETRRIDRPDSGKCIGEHSSERYRRIRKGGGSRKPVRAGNVETDRHRNRFGAQAGTTPNDTKQTESCNKF